MAAETHSFIDIAALDAVRGHFAAGAAVVILTADLARVLWSNGPGAALLGFPGIEAAIDSDSGLSRIARRQIEATPGFPRIGPDRAISVRLAAGLNSQAIVVRASHLTLHGDEAAIMLVVPLAASSTRSSREIAARAVSGFDEPGGYLALLDAAGDVLAATAGFEGLGIDAEARAALVTDAASQDDRLTKRLIRIQHRTLPVGLARLTDDPAVHLLITVDERQIADEDELAAAPDAIGDGSQAAIASAVEENDEESSAPSEPQADLFTDETAGLEVAAEAMAAPSLSDEHASDDHAEVSTGSEEAESASIAPAHDNWYFNSVEPASTVAEIEPAAESAEDENASPAESTEPVSATAEPEPVMESAKDEQPLPVEIHPKPVADVDRDAPPVRFVWRTDAEGRFSALSPEFATAVGAEAADIVGRSFADVARRLALDPAGEIAGLLERRDTWSGRSVFWPIAGTDFKAPVDLAALPAYGRERQFEGFRGFGVVRPAEAVVDPLSIGMTLVAPAKQALESAAPAEEASAEEPAVDAAEQSADPFKGEVPALEVTPKPQRRFSDKVIRLAEHRLPANDKGLTPLERVTFREIGEQLKRTSGVPVAEGKPVDAGKPEATATLPETGEADRLESIAAASIAADEPNRGPEAAMEIGPAYSEAETTIPLETAAVESVIAQGEPMDQPDSPPVAEEAAVYESGLPPLRPSGPPLPPPEGEEGSEIAAAGSSSPPSNGGEVAAEGRRSGGRPSPDVIGDSPAVRGETASGQALGDDINEDTDALVEADGESNVAARTVAAADAAAWHPQAGPLTDEPDAAGTVEEPPHSPEFNAPIAAVEHTVGEAVEIVDGADEPRASDEASSASDISPPEAEEAAPLEFHGDALQSEPVGEDERQSGDTPTPDAITQEAGDAAANTVAPSERVSRSLLDFASPQGEPAVADNGPAPGASAEADTAPTAVGESQPADATQIAEADETDTVSPAGKAMFADDHETPAEIFDPAEAAESLAPSDESGSKVEVDAPAPTPRPLKQNGFLPSAFAERVHSAAPRADTSILAQLPIPVLIHSGDTLHYANDAFLALTGYESIDDLAARGGLDDLLSGPAEDRKEGDNRVMLKPRAGEQFPVSAFLQSVPWMGGKALLLTLTRQQNVSSPLPVASTSQESDLPARIAELRTILDTATDGVVLIANDGSVRSISRPAEALFGYDSDQVVGKPFTSLFAIESQRAARDYLAGLSDNGVASVLNDGREVIGREAQGRYIPLFMTIGRLPGDSGYCAVLRDITQWKRAEEDLTQARAQAERTSSQKSDFLARVSHEIRTPLNAIIGFSELMLDEKFGPVANDRYRDYLRDINRSGNHVLDLVNDLLDISKIEAGQQEMDYEAVALNDSLAETVAMMQPQANRERVIIRSSFAAKLPEVVADLRSVRQIALNILSNAVRYTQAGGQVIVSTAYEPNGEVVMRVRDTGIGMTQAEIEQALKPFKQINSLKRARGDGTGLGLPLTKAMVEANRAKFAIYSTPGEGTLVEVTFPSTRVLAE